MVMIRCNPGELDEGYGNCFFVPRKTSSSGAVLNGTPDQQAVGCGQHVVMIAICELESR
jgi:hypothetical protein